MKPQSEIEMDLARTALFEAASAEQSGEHAWAYTFGQAAARHIENALMFSWAEDSVREQAEVLAQWKAPEGWTSKVSGV